MRGVVKWFNDEKGFGFILAENGKDVFAHFGNIVGDGYKTLEEDENVEFELQEGKYGMNAINIKRIDKDLTNKDEYLGRGSMISPKELREMADAKKKSEGDEFVSLIMPEIEKLMRVRANSGEYQLELRNNHLLHTNFDNWLSKPHLIKPVIKHLENYGFKVTHNDDVRDGTYMIIKW